MIMYDNKLLLNDAKTDFLLIGTEQQLAKVNIPHVKVGNATMIPPHSPVKLVEFGLTESYL